MQIPLPHHAAVSALPTVAGPDAEVPASFVDRRQSAPGLQSSERRQFASLHAGLSSEARELALAIDGYKVRHRRRYITFEEMLSVIGQLGYRRGES